MSYLIKRIIVPNNVRKTSLCPQEVEIYDDHVSCIGGLGGSWFYKDFTGVSSQAASVANAYASVVFLNAVSSSNSIKVGAQHLMDRNRISFCSGMFSYASANQFTAQVTRDIRSALEQYKSNNSTVTEKTIVKDSLSPADELKKYKELLDMEAITQEEYNAKKKKLLNI